MYGIRGPSLLREGESKLALLGAGAFLGAEFPAILSERNLSASAKAARFVLKISGISPPSI